VIGITFRIGTNPAYGLATTLYALFSGGHLPHSVPIGGSLALLRTIQLTVRPAPLMGLAPQLEPRVERTIMKGLSANPAARPAVRKIVLALERAHVRATAAPGRESRGLTRLARFGGAVYRLLVSLLKRRSRG